MYKFLSYPWFFTQAGYIGIHVHGRQVMSCYVIVTSSYSVAPQCIWEFLGVYF